MEILDIHTHKPSECAILNESPVSFSPQAGQYYSLGIHPWHVKEENEEEWEALQLAAQHPQVLAIGEAGLDKAVATELALQEKVFVRQAGLAEQLNKPLIIHSVRSSNEIISYKKKHSPRVPWIIHGFRGNELLAAELLRHGFYLSFGEKYQAEAMRKTPPDKLFIETDESGENIMELYRRAAKCLSVPEDRFADLVRLNINHVFFSR